MKRAWLPIAVICLGLNVLSPAQDLDEFSDKTTLQAPQEAQNAAPPISMLSGGSERDQATERKLKFSAADMAPFDETEFRDVLKDFRERYGIEFMIDRSATDDELQPSTLITHQQATLTAGEFLESIANLHNATYMVRNGVVVFISRDVANDWQYHSLRIFDVRKILEKLRAELPASVERYPSPPQTPFGPGMSGGMFQIIGEEPNVVPPEAAETETEQKAEQVLVVRRLWPEEQLKNLLLRTITPNHWSDTQGEATITLLAGRLIVTHQRSALIEIENFLEDFERALEE
jgi:hypothetical protein